MREVRPSCEDEFIEWYLHREAHKRREPASSVPTTAQERRQFFGCVHSGKVFARGFRPESWGLVELERPTELECLVILESRWTKRRCLVAPEMPNGRLLSYAVDVALRTGYFQSSDYLQHRTFDYYGEMRHGSHLPLRQEERIVLRDLVPSERRSNPEGSFYLHDGLGRCLAYLALLKEGRIVFSPVEAFLARSDA